jgi:hypothetical protein
MLLAKGIFVAQIFWDFLCAKIPYEKHCAERGLFFVLNDSEG